MGWFDKSDKLIAIGEKVTDGIMTGIDKAWFTVQEKAQMSMEAISAHTAFIKDTLAESSIRSVTRRQVAFCVMAMDAFAFVICMVLAIIGSTKLGAALSVVEAFNLSALTLMVVGFFFGSHLIRGAVKGK